jgi:hypothetical protein
MSSMDPRDYIDPDEGREDSEGLKAFYADAKPCESCGHPTWKGRRWDEEFQGWIAVDCACNTPSVPTCPPLIPLIEAAVTVAEICKVIREHRASCPLCGPTPFKRPETDSPALPEAA